MSLIVVVVGYAGLAGGIAVVVQGVDVIGDLQAEDLATARDDSLSHRAASSAYEVLSALPAEPERAFPQLLIASDWYDQWTT
jgi:hypothetical protein